MKPTLLFTTLTMILATPSVFAKSELETLRSLCAEQERQIRQLEEENTRMRADAHEALAPKTQSDLKTSVKPATVAAMPDSPASAESAYTVKAGDSFDKIARKIGVSPEKLAKSNGLKPGSIIRPGQKLKVPGATAQASAPAPEPAAPATAPVVQKDNGKTYKVRQGDTFYSISKKQGVSTAALIAANPTVKPSALRPGLVIKLGGNESTTTISTPKAPAPVEKAPAPAPVVKAPEVKHSAPIAEVKHSTPAAAKAPAAATAPPETKPAPAASKPPVEEQETAAAAAPEKKPHPVTIEGEMTYGEFAAKHGTDAERLNALNGLDLTTATILAKGSELYVPAQP